MLLAESLLGSSSAVAPTYIEDVFSTYLYTGNSTSGGTQSVANGISLGDFGVGTSTEFNGSGSGDYLDKSYSTNSLGLGSKTFTFSAWFWWDGTTSETIFQTPTFLISCNQPAGNVLTLSGYSNTYSTILGWDSVAALNKNTWNNVIISLDLSDSSKRHVYINDVLVSGNYNTYTNTPIGFDVAGTATISSASATWTGKLANVYLDYTYRDLSNSTNRRLFIDSNGGSTPPSTLSALNPVLYFPMTGDYVIGKNLGTGGDFTSNGTPSIVQSGTQYVAGYGKGGMVWIKGRSAAANNVLFDTARGAGTTASNNQAISSNLTTAEDLGASHDFLSAFNADGFTVTQGGTTTATRGTNYNNVTYASWTFRKQAKFFDIVTYTGTGANRTVSHNLGSVPGCIITKRTDTTGNWITYHRSLGNTDFVNLNGTAATAAESGAWNNTTPTSTEFSLGTGNTNVNGGTYVAYLFAHDAGGFGAAGTDNVISCGSFTTDGSGNATVTLGYEPQWCMFKRATGGTGNWTILDNMRGWVVGGNDNSLQANLSSAETSASNLSDPNATGFSVAGISASSTYIYIAIRRGPMKTPTSGTSVFSPDIGNNSTSSGGEIFTSGFPVDFFMRKDRATTDYAPFAYSRLTAGKYLVTGTTAAEATDTSTWFDTNTGINYQYASNLSGQIGWLFRRAPGFFDVVCYTGTGANRTVSHNLGVAPELMIVKSRSSGVYDWRAYSATLGATKYLTPNASSFEGTSSTSWNDTAPTTSVFTVGSSAVVNGSGATYVAYLFATVAGVSKVGSYTGTGTTLQIDCGFTGGARFVLIKRSDDSGDWYVWDTARGIIAGNDPYLLLNSTAAEVTSTDYIDTYSAGFELSSTAPAALNANGGTYIFLAIA